MSSNEEWLMRDKIDACLRKVTKVMEKDRAAKIHAADEVSHQYADKFLLADTITNTMCASLVHCMSMMGLSRENLMALKTLPADKSVTLSFRYNRKTTLLREQEREVESPTRVQETSDAGTSTMSVITKVKEYVFLEEQTHQLVAFTGVGDNAAEFLTAFSRSGSTEYTCTYKSNDGESSSHDDVDLSWLLGALSSGCDRATFTIDRSHAACFTPTQNRDVEQATDFVGNFRDFARRVMITVAGWRKCQAGVKPRSKSRLLDFTPVAPLFEASGEPTAAPLSSESINALLHEYQRKLVELCTEAETGLPASATSSTTAPLFSSNEAKLEAATDAVFDLCHSYHLSIDFLENMIRKQLVAAIGKTVSAQDFAQYMTFHNRKVFKEAYQPQPFSYAVRRSPVHSPEGQIQIETSSNATPAEPIYTVSQHVENAPHMEFALNATTTVKFGGKRHLHGWMAHRFSGQAMPQLKLVAEARQFSSYIVLIGRIASATLFQPKYGFIVQNKDEFRIPLDLEHIPTAKEFKDAISSLSPEQQRFAKAFRSMQLESTLFGVCVIQIKPQLEKVLKLEADSLTKEIKLTQDLMQLFIKYQIPTDLLSYQGQDQEGGGGAELSAVKGHAQALQEVLLSAKEEEVAEAELQRGLKRGRDDASDNEEDGSDEESEYEDWDEEEEDYEGDAWVKYSRSSFYTQGMRARKSAPATGGIRPVRRRSASPVKRTRADKPDLKESSALAHQLSAEPEQSSRALDFTAYPTKLEEMYTQYDPDSSLRPTIINPGATWTKRSQKGLLSAPQSTSLTADLQAIEKTAAFDLLDALTRSGALPIEHASLHVIIAATHCFDQSVMDTVVQKNVNPIERVERSTLIMAAALNDVPASALIRNSQVDRVREFSPMLFPPLLLPTVAVADEPGLLMNED